ncbi:TIGR02678 family protein [Streptomyces sp. JJ36]|uniref:TIGR02678 family protein n=1 Tax=Streptomyces sp. JJ36 TaxID=2736645 RepID=UPI001F29F196|nr:TIGR02678 family protein [Streptomyces sp. JJ36]
MTTSLGDVLDGRRAAELQRAARALLKEPLLLAHGPSADAFRLVRQYAGELRDWFERNTGWALRVDAEAARLHRTPGTLTDATHPARETARARAPFTRRRYVLLCLALAALERGESQTALGRLAEQVVLDAADPQLAAAGIEFTLERREERADLAAVVRLLLRYGVLRRVAGDEDAYVSGSGDVLYDVQRRVLAGLLSARRGPSTLLAGGFAERLTELTAETALDSEELSSRSRTDPGGTAALRRLPLSIFWPNRP